MRNYWLITTEYPPLYGGGIGTYCYYVAQMLAREGWSVTVFVAAKNANKDRVIEENGIRVVEFAINRTKAWDYLGYDTALAFEFAVVLKEYLEKEGAPTVLESQEYAGIAYFILQYKHLGYPLFKELKVLLAVHAPSFLYYDYNRVPAFQLPYYWIGQMERWCMMAADLLHAPSQYISHAVQPYFPSPLRGIIHAVPYPYESFIKKIDLEADPRKRWFFFGKLTPQKGVIQLLKTFKNLWDAGWQEPLHLIGGGDHYFHPENTSFNYWIQKKYGAEIKKGRLQLLGGLAPERWQKLLQESAVIIIPSLVDNYPYTVVESLAAGQLVLASRQGGQVEIITHGENGFLFDHALPGDFEKQLTAIANLSEEQVKNVRHKAISSVAQKHSHQNAYLEKENVINQLLETPLAANCFPFVVASSVPGPVTKHASTADLLSVVIPYYNMGLYLEEALQSIILATYSSVEVIVVDDGSNDEHSIRQLDFLQQTYRFQIVRQENKGLSAARNAGALVARGAYLAFLDADDKVAPSYFEKAIDILRSKQNVYFVSSWIQYFEKSTAIWPAFTPEFPYLLYHNMVCSQGLVYKKEAFLSHGWNDAALEYGLEDWDSVISLVANGWNGVVIPEPLYQYRIRKGSMARQFTTEKLLYSTNHIAKKNKELFAIFAPDLIGLANANGPGFKVDNPTLDYKTYGLLPEGFPFVKKLVKVVKRMPLLKKGLFALYRVLKK